MVAKLTIQYSDGQITSARRHYTSEIELIIDVKREFNTLPFDGVTVTSAIASTIYQKPIISYAVTR